MAARPATLRAVGPIAPAGLRSRQVNRSHESYFQTVWGIGSHGHGFVGEFQAVLATRLQAVPRLGWITHGEPSLLRARLAMEVGRTGTGNNSSRRSPAQATA